MGTFWQLSESQIKHTTRLTRIAVGPVRTDYRETEEKESVFDILISNEVVRQVENLYRGWCRNSMEALSGLTMGLAIARDLLQDFYNQYFIFHLMTVLFFLTVLGLQSLKCAILSLPQWDMKGSPLSRDGESEIGDR